MHNLDSSSNIFEETSDSDSKSEQDEYLTDMEEVECPDCGETNKKTEKIDLKWQCDECGYLFEEEDESKDVIFGEDDTDQEDEVFFSDFSEYRAVKGQLEGLRDDLQEGENQ